MNNTQVRLVLDRIERDVNVKTSNFFDRLNSNEGPVECKTIFGWLNNSVTDIEDNTKVIRKINNYLREKNISDSTLKDYTSKFGSKISSVNELRMKLYANLTGKQMNYDKLVYDLAYGIKKAVYEDDNITPSFIVNKLNKDRSSVSIENTFPKYDSKVFKNYSISASQMAQLGNNDNFDNLKSVGLFLLKNFHYSIQVKNECEEPQIDGRHINIPKSYLVNDVKNGTGAMLGALNATYLVTNELVDFDLEDTIKQFAKKYSEVASTKVLIDALNRDSKQKVIDASNEIIKLLTTVNVLRFGVNPSCFKPLEQVVLTKANSLLTDVSNLFNDNGLIYAIGKAVELNCAEIFKKVRMNSAEAEKVFGLSGVKFSDDNLRRVNEMFVSNQTYTLSPEFISGYDSSVVEFSYNNVVNDEVYINSHKKYEQYFGKICGNGFVPFTKVDMEEQCKKAKEIYSKIIDFENKVKALKEVHKSQYLAICDVCAYMDCAKENLLNIDAKHFNNQLAEMEENLEIVGSILSEEPVKGQQNNFASPEIEKPVEAPKIVETPTNVESIKVEEKPVERAMPKPIEMPKPVEMPEPVKMPEPIKETNVEQEPVVEPQPKVETKKQDYNTIDEKYTFNLGISSFTIDSTPVSKEAPKVERKEVSLKDQVKAYLHGELKNAISELVSDNLSELDTEINDINKYHTADEIKQCSMIMSSLNTLIKLPDGDNTVKNLYVAMGKKEQYVNLLKLKEILFTDFIGKLTDYIVLNANNASDKNIREIVNESLIKLNEKHIYDLEQKRLSIIDMQTSLLIPGYADMVDKITDKYDNIISNAKIAYEVEKDEIGEEQAKQKLKDRISRAEQLKQIEIKNIVKDNLPDENYIEYDDTIKGIDKKFYGSKNNFADRGLIGKVKENLTFEMLKFSLIDLSKTIYYNNQFNPDTKIDGKLIDDILDTVFVNNKKSNISSDELIHE